MYIIFLKSLYAIFEFIKNMLKQKKLWEIQGRLGRFSDYEILQLIKVKIVKDVKT